MSKNEQNLTHEVESDPVLRIFLDSLTDQAVFALDPEGVITTWNEGCVRLKGYSPEEAVGQNYRMLYRREDQERGHPERNLAKALAEGVVHEEALRVRKGGREFMAEVSIYPIEEKGRHAGFAKIVRDVTKRRQHEADIERLSAKLRAEESKLLTLVKDAPAFVAILDGRDLKFTYANDACTRLLGPRPIIGLPLAEAVPEISGQGWLEILQAVFDTGNPYVQAERSFTLAGASDGSLAEHFIDVSLQPARDPDGVIVGVLIHSVDRTERVRTRRALESLNAELEIRVMRSTEDLVSRNLELERFTYSVSHDMRTPLRAMGSNVMMVVEDEGKRLSDEGRYRLDRVSKAAVRMGQLIDDLLKYARLGRREIIPQAVSVSRIAEDAVREMGIEHVDCEVTIDLDPGLTVEGDPYLLGIVLQNLFENACKYRRMEAASVVRLGMEEIEGELRFFVCDNGIGFDMAFIEKIFQPFERLHREEYAGTGIGLANVRRAIERHGGRVWAESVLGEGATFYFTLG